jgi:lysozyme
MVSAMALSPMPKGQGRLSKAVGGAGAAALLIGLVAGFEGKRNDPYLDIVKVPTVCYGETRVAMRHYTDAECDDMLADGLADFAGPVLMRNPELEGHTPQLAAAVSLAYNIGAANYAKSTVARRFSAGNWRGACDAFLRWSNAGGKRVAGLVRRREAERALCLRGLA